MLVCIRIVPNPVILSLQLRAEAVLMDIPHAHPAAHTLLSLRMKFCCVFFFFLKTNLSDSIYKTVTQPDA